MTSLGPVLAVVAQMSVVFVIATFAFDCVHWLLHRLARVPWPLLQKLASWHVLHHTFLGQDLALRRDLVMANTLYHLVPELLTQLAVSSLFYCFFAPLAVVLVQLILAAIFATVVLLLGGVDLNHRPGAKVTAPRIGLYVEPQYHYLHHAYPQSYLSSYVPLFDWVFGTGCQIAGRRFAVTGASGTFGAAFCQLLTAAGAASVARLHYGLDWSDASLAAASPGLDTLLGATDVLVLAHGSRGEQAMAANCTSFVLFIERFKSVAAHRQIPPEVWAIGSEIEAHPAFGDAQLQLYSASKRAYARHAWSYYRDPQLIYRHIVPSAFSSPMGRGLMSGRTAARLALFLIRRGFRYIPVTYTGVAVVNIWRFWRPRRGPPV